MTYDVCVLGGCSVDLIRYQKQDGEYGKNPDKIAFGGKASNQAIASSRAGAKTIVLTKLVSDDMGFAIEKNLTKNEVVASRIDWCDSGENSYSEVYINNTNKDNKLKKHYGVISTFDEKMLTDNEDVILNSKYVVLQLKCPMDLTEKVINFCYENGVKVCLTPCHPDKIAGRDDLLDKISYITCNEDEFKAVWNNAPLETILHKYPKKLIVTLGGDGLAYSNGREVVMLKPCAEKVVDTIGAGDCFCGNLIAQLAQGVDFESAVWRSNIASGYKVGFEGAQFGVAKKEELDNYILKKNTQNFEYADKLQLAVNSILQATQKLYSDDNLQISTKEDKSFVTKCDLFIEKYLCDKIKQNYSCDNIVSEEYNTNAKLVDASWVIDPIDGTAHFIRNDGMWTVQLSYYDKGETQFSVIYNKQRDEILYCAKGFGAFCNGYPLDLREKQLPLNECVLEISGSMRRKLGKKLSIFESLVRDEKYLISNMFTLNSAGYSYSNLATGRVDALVSCTLKLWDKMAGEFMCKELGYKFIALDNTQPKLYLITKQKELMKFFEKNNVFAMKQSKIEDFCK